MFPPGCFGTNFVTSYTPPRPITQQSLAESCFATSSGVYVTVTVAEDVPVDGAVSFAVDCRPLKREDRLVGVATVGISKESECDAPRRRRHLVLTAINHGYIHSHIYSILRANSQP